MRICSQCKKSKSLTEYSFGGSRSSGYRRYNCKDCQNNRSKAVYWADPEKSRFRQVLRLYDLSEIEYKHMLTEQSYSCKLCLISQEKLKKRLYVDHCHKTGKVRGLLCLRCNALIGHWENSRQLFDMFDDYVKIPSQTAESDRSNRD